MKRFLAILLLLALATAAKADKVKVRLYSNNTISTLSISFDLGAYNLYVDGNRLLEDMVGDGRLVQIQAKGSRMNIKMTLNAFGIDISSLGFVA